MKRYEFQAARVIILMMMHKGIQLEVHRAFDWLSHLTGDLDTLKGHSGTYRREHRMGQWQGHLGYRPCWWVISGWANLDNFPVPNSFLWMGKLSKVLSVLKVCASLCPSLTQGREGIQLVWKNNWKSFTCTFFDGKDKNHLKGIM